jgi:hypothetical protein
MSEAEALVRLLAAVERLEAELQRSYGDRYDYVPSNIRHGIIAVSQAAEPLRRRCEAA